MRCYALWRFWAALCAVAGMTVVPASAASFICHYSTSVSVAIQTHVDAVTDAFLDPPPSAFSYAYDVGAAYTNIIYQQDLHLCAANSCPRSFPNRVTGTAAPGKDGPYSDYTVDALQYFTYFVRDGSAYTLETAPIAAYNYTLYAHEPLADTETCAAGVANLTLCCLYQTFGFTFDVEASQWQVSNDQGIQVTRLEHPSRPGGCSTHFSNPLVGLQAVLLTSYTVAPSSQCVAVEQLPWNDPVPAF